MKKRLDEETAKKIVDMLIERFGEPIASARAGQGVNDERGGKPRKGAPMKNRGFGSSQLDETRDFVSSKLVWKTFEKLYTESGTVTFADLVSLLGATDDAVKRAMLDVNLYVDDNGEVHEDTEMSESDDDLDEVTPPGEEKLVKKLKKQKGVKNPWALAWKIHNKKNEGKLSERLRHPRPNVSPVEVEQTFEDLFINSGTVTIEDLASWLTTTPDVVMKAMPRWLVVDKNGNVVERGATPKPFPAIK